MGIRRVVIQSTTRGLERERERTFDLRTESEHTLVKMAESIHYTQSVLLIDIVTICKGRERYKGQWVW